MIEKWLPIRPIRFRRPLGLIGNHSSSNKRKWGGGSRLRCWGDDRCSMEGASELSQQSIAESTHFFSTTDIFGRNTPFSARFRNSLTLKRLCSLRITQHSAFNRPHYKTCLFATRNMPRRDAKHARSQVETYQTVSGAPLTDNAILQKQLFRFLLCRKCPTNFMAKNPDHSHSPGIHQKRKWPSFHI